LYEPSRDATTERGCRDLKLCSKGVIPNQADRKGRTRAPRYPPRTITSPLTQCSHPVARPLSVEYDSMCSMSCIVAKKAGASSKEAQVAGKSILHSIKPATRRASLGLSLGISLGIASRSCAGLSHAFACAPVQPCSNFPGENPFLWEPMATFHHRPPPPSRRGSKLNILHLHPRSSPLLATMANNNPDRHG
jgi:hypothetical protein